MSANKQDIKKTQEDVKLIGARLDVMLRELATMVRVTNQQLATRIEETRHSIKGQLTTPINVVSMMEVKERTNGTTARA